MPVEKSPLPDCDVQLHDVLGFYSGASASFVDHAGLCGQPAKIDLGKSPVRITHVRPPLEDRDDLKPSLVGRLNLTDDEKKQVSNFIATTEQQRRAGELRKDNYIVSPHSEPVQRGGVLVSTRFSCAGFVLESYRFARINLVETEAAELPPVDNVTLESIYPDLKTAGPRTRARIGLSGDGPWPVLLPGYLFHSLARDRREVRSVPYIPKSGDELFP